MHHDIKNKHMLTYKHYFPFINDWNSHELWKPRLRAEMESDMTAVSEGRKRKDEVLQTCLQRMKACFLDVRLYVLL